MFDTTLWAPINKDTSRGHSARFGSRVGQETIWHNGCDQYLCSETNSRVVVRFEEILMDKTFF